MSKLTAEELIARWDDGLNHHEPLDPAVLANAERLVRTLWLNGYRIVHPDDMAPTDDDRFESHPYALGWADCFQAMFDAQPEELQAEFHAAVHWSNEPQPPPPPTKTTGEVLGELRERIARRIFELTDISLSKNAGVASSAYHQKVAMREVLDYLREYEAPSKPQPTDPGRLWKR